MQPQNDNQSQRPRPRISIWYAVAAALILVFVLTFILNFNSSTGKKYSDADLTQIDDVNGNKTDGELYKILNEGNVIYLNVANHDNAKYYALEGRYYTLDANNKKQTYNFTATFSSTNDEVVTNYFTIINNRTTNIDDKLVKYYSTSNTRITYNVVDYTSQVSVWSYLPTILIWVLIIGMGFFLVSRLSKSMGSMNSQQMNFNQSKARRELNSKVKFRDVAGCDEVKAELVEMVDYFKNAAKYTRLGAKLPKGVLLVGPPGTGKTLLAKAVAGEANVPFYSISGSDFVEMYVGVGAGRVRDMFKVAKQNAPCLIFIDEIDAVGRQRGAGLGGGNDEREQTLNQLLVEMDGFEDNSGVIVMAATNRADVLDPALLRAGRFDRQITVDLPDKDGREAILKVHARNKVIDPSVDFAAIASRTVGFSGADLANILNDAAILAVRSKRETVLMSDIDEAIDRSIAGPAKSNRTISLEEKRRIAYHESGHAVIGLMLPHSDKVQKITIIPRGRTGGHVLMTPENDRFVLTKQELLSRITGFLGGRTSEEIFFGDVSTGASNDIERATEIARTMVTEYGMSELGPIQYERNSGSVFLGRDYSSQKANYSTQIAFEIDKAVRGIVEECHKTATDLLTEHRADVELIAKTLMDKETITAEEIEYLLKNGKLPEVKKEVEIDEVKDENKTVVVTPVSAPVEEKKVETETNETVVKFTKELDLIKEFTGLICLFVSSDKGEEMLVRTANKIIKDSTNNYLKRMSGIGQAESNKLKTASALFIDKTMLDEMKKTPEEMGEFIENYTNSEVILVLVKPTSFEKVRSSFDKRKPSFAQNKEAKQVANDLKDLVNHDKDSDK